MATSVSAGRAAVARSALRVPGFSTGDIDRGTAAKVLLILVLDVVGFFVLRDVFASGESGLAWFLAVVLVAANVVYLHPRAHGYKFLFPGVALLALFVVWPAIYTVFISTTNYGTGHILSPEQAAAQVEATSATVDEDATRLPLVIAERGDGSLAWLLEETDGTFIYGGVEGATAIEATDVVRDDNDRIVEVQGDAVLGLAELSAVQDEVLGMAVPLEDGRVLSTANAIQAVVRVPTLDYDEATNTFTSRVDGTVYTAIEGTWTAPDGRQLTPGYRADIGAGNYEEIVSSSSVRNAFLRIFVWNVAFAAITVAGGLAFGLFVAITLNHPTMRGLRFYRSLLIIPYAIPTFVTALVWRGMFRAGDGIFARALPEFLEVNWFGDPWLAKVAVLITNIWLSFPYFFVVSLAFLQTMPSELTEAAKVDGATSRQIFSRITWPLLFVAMTPVLIASFAFTFNSFNTIELLTSGDPVIRGTSDAGHTDILISFAYNLALNSVEGSRFAFSATVSVFIFAIVALITTIGFTRSEAFKSI